MTSRVVRPLFRVGCHSAATAGARVARQLAVDARFPAQNGQPWPSPRDRANVCQTWSDAFGHCHQIRLSDHTVTSLARKAPLSAGCQLFASAGILATVRPLRRFAIRVGGPRTLARMLDDWGTAERWN